MSDYFKRYTEVCLERDRLREENQKLKTYLAKKSRHEERVKMIIEERNSLREENARMKAVVSAARKALVILDAGDGTIAECGAASFMRDALKNLDEKGDGV